MNDSPLRVLNILARLNIGGPALQVTLMSDAIGPPDFQSLLAAGVIDESEGDMSYLADDLGVEKVTIESLQREVNPVNDLKALWALYRLMRKFKPHIVHTHTAKAGFIGRVAAAMAGVPIKVHTFHGHVFRGYFGPRKTQLFLTLERIGAKLSDRIFTLTDRLKYEISEEFGVCSPDLIDVLPLGLDLKRFEEKERHSGEFRKTWSIPEDAKLVGIVGRLVPIKNHKLFVEAAALIKKSVPEAHFVVIGDGETRSATEAQVAELGLTSEFTFTGWHRYLEKVYSDLDVVVLCSDNEGTPVSLIEAMAGGCPIVSTDVGGVKELLNQGKFGAVVPPGEVEALATATRISLSRGQAVASRSEIRKQYGIERLADEFRHLYHELAVLKGLKA